MGIEKRGQPPLSSFRKEDQKHRDGRQCAAFFRLKRSNQYGNLHGRKKACKSAASAAQLAEPDNARSHRSECKFRPGATNATAAMPAQKLRRQATLRRRPARKGVTGETKFQLAPRSKAKPGSLCPFSNIRLLRGRLRWFVVV